MKNTLVLLFLALFSVNALSQTVTSVTNGDFLMPTTWDCMCIPYDGYFITINHDVALASDYLISSGGITINSGGSLVGTGSGYGLWVTGSAYLDIQGAFTYSKLLVTSGTLSNSGTMNGLDSLYVGVDFTNDGSVITEDFFNGGTMINNWYVDAVNFLNESSFTNNQTADLDNFFNDSIAVNIGTLNAADMYNNADLNNQGTMNISHDFTNAHAFFNESNFTVANNCTNGDSLSHDAVWTNNSIVTIYMNFQNLDTLFGYGSFCIGQNTANYGYMDGTYMFCDNSNPGTIDVNSGFIGAGITYCSSPCLSSILENDVFPVQAYPNPSSEIINIESSETVMQFSVLDIAGRVIRIEEVNDTQFAIGVEDLKAGFYYIRLDAENAVQVISVVVK